MIRACASNIRSGWRTIFAILEVSVICVYVRMCV
jgi:hypothetical protein